MVKIVPLKKEHLDSVYKIEVESFTIPWSKRDLVKDALENEVSIYLVALENERVIGYAGMWHIVTEGHITNIAVDSMHRNKGIGDMLINHITKIAIEKEMVGITLEVRISNIPAQKLYLKHGFKVEGFRKNYYPDTKEDAIIMWKYV